MKKSVLNSPRFLELKRKKRKVFVRKALILLLLFILILIGLSFLSKWQRININNIQISGNKIIETKAVEEIVKENLAGNYLWIFPKTNFIIYPQNKIETELKNKFKRIKEVFVNNKNINTLEIIISERTALYTYCGIAPASSNLGARLPSEEKCYFMDESGYIFDEAPYFSGEVYLKFYGQADSYFFEPNFGKLVSLREVFKKMSLNPAVFFVEDTGDIKVFLSSTTPQFGPYIIFKASDNFDQIVENLQSILLTESFQAEFKTKYSSLLYIDLRFGNKIYYKFK